MSLNEELLFSSSIIFSKPTISKSCNKSCNKKKKPCHEESDDEEKSESECDSIDSDHVSLISQSSYDSFDSFIDSEELLVHEIIRARVLYKKQYNKN
jgi:hypothetical protein